MAKSIAVSFAEEWVQAWNSRDVESLLSHYSENVEFRSNLVVRLGGEESGTVRGKHHLREYFQKALAAFPGDLGIELRGVYQGVGSRVVLFEAQGRKGAEFMEFDSDGAVCRASAHSHVV